MGWTQVEAMSLHPLRGPWRLCSPVLLLLLCGGGTLSPRSSCTGQGVEGAKVSLTWAGDVEGQQIVAPSAPWTSGSV